MKTERHFVKGVGTYKCECCNRTTRIVSDPTAYYTHRLCEPCYDLAGFENLHSDESHPGDLLDCPTCGEDCRLLIARGAKR
jgi:hypothetical protein